MAWGARGSSLSWLGVALGSVLVLVALGLAILRPLRKQERAAKSNQGLPMLSIDRGYWWDGSRWQDGTILVPQQLLDPVMAPNGSTACCGAQFHRRRSYRQARTGPDSRKGSV